MLTSESRLAQFGIVAGLALIIGWAIAQTSIFALAALLTAVGCLALLAPTAWWIAVTIAMAVSARALTSVGLPSAFNYADIPLAWGCLLVAFLRLRPIRHIRYFTALGAFLAAAVISGLLAHSEPQRVALLVGLFGQPFAVIGAMLLDPPDEKGRRIITRALVAVLAVQLPIAGWETWHHGFGTDAVKGTQIGSLAGHHVISAVCVVGGLWLVGRGAKRWAWLLFAVPFAAGAKQVILGFPAVVLTGRFANRRRWMVTAVVATAGVLLLLAVPSLNDRYTSSAIAHAPRGGKAYTAKVVWRDVRSGPISLVFGMGPADTVSHAAFLTTDPLTKPGSPLAALHVTPAQLPQDLSYETRRGATGSFDNPQSSAIGLLGDLGLAGTAAYVWLFALVLMAVRRVRGPEADAAAAGLGMMALLAFVNDWLEQPAFTVFVAALAGLALTGDSARSYDAKVL